MQTQFVYQPTLEGRRLLNVYWSLGRNIYIKNGFYVLPYRIVSHRRVVYLPELPGINHVQLAQEVGKLRGINVSSKDEALVRYGNVIREALKGRLETIDKQATRKVEELWLKMEDAFENCLVTILPELRGKRLSLVVYWTRYGSLMSYDVVATRGVATKMAIFLRDDMGVAEIVEGVVSSLLSGWFVKNKISWVQMESVFDFLILKTGLASFAPDFVGTVLGEKKRRQRIEGQIIKDSQAYLQRLGFANWESILECRQGVVYVKGKAARVSFGQKEYRFLEMLLRHMNEPVSYFDLADRVWQDEDEFSLWALSQLAYKVKNKLRREGLSPDMIKNVRGVGYMLVLEG